MSKSIQTKTIHQLPEDGFIKLPVIVKVPGSDNPPLIPVSRSSWLAGVKSGRYPQSVKIGMRSVAWRVSDIKKLIAELGCG
jgi:prophage regulatory protein